MEPNAPLDEAAISGLVDAFYEKVRRDPALGAVFNDAVHDWDEHKLRLTAFWSAVALGTRRYRGQPMAVHQARRDIHAGHFTRWLALWKETTAERLAPAHAAIMQQHAERIGESLRYGMGLGRSRDQLGLPVHPG